MSDSYLNISDSYLNVLCVECACISLPHAAVSGYLVRSHPLSCRTHSHEDVQSFLVIPLALQAFRALVLGPNDVTSLYLEYRQSDANDDWF